MEGKRRIHRHFLAAPLLLALLVASFASRSDIEASVTSQELVNETESPRIERLDDGVHVMLFKQSSADISEEVIILNKGSVLVSGEGIVKLEAGSFKLTGLSGAYYATLAGGEVTVAAITSPVLVEQEGKYVLVPVGYQWKESRELSGLESGYGAWSESRDLIFFPERFRTDQLNNLSLFPEENKKPHISFSLLHMNLNRAFGFLKLPRAREREYMEMGNGTLMQLHELVSSSHEDEAIAILSAASNRYVFASTRGRSVLAGMLSESKENKPLLTAIMSSLFTDERMWLLCIIHPEFRDAAWGIVPPKLSEEARDTYLFAFPQSDVLPEAYPRFVLEGWEQDFDERVMSLRNPGGFLESLLSILVDLTNSFSNRDFPQRARSYADIITGISNRYGEFLPSAQKEEIMLIRREGEVEVEVTEDEVGEEVDNEEAKQTEEELTPDQVRRLAYELLRGNGALFTVETKIEPSSPLTASIENIVFSSPKGDHMISFTLNVVSGGVSGVLFEGKTLPYSLELDEFVEWVRG